ncbi:MAG: glycosyltransferase family 4 protein [Ginsengibacter sp.]
MKKKVLIVANLSMHIMKVRKSLIRILEDSGYDVEIITARDKYFDILIHEEYKIHELHALNSRGQSLFEQFRVYYEYKKLYKEIKPDFIFHYTIKPNIYGTFAATSLKIPSVITINGLGQVYENPLLFKTVSVIFKLACKQSKAVIFQNADDLNLFLSKKLVAKNKTVLVNGSGIDCELFSPVICKNSYSKKNGESLKFALTARLLWTKGLKEYYEAAKKIKKKYPLVTFYIVGYLQEDPKIGVTAGIIKLWQESGIIKFLDAVSDIREILCECDVAVLPSYYREGVPRVLIEGLAMAKPIITTDSVGCKETVIDNWNGFKVPVKNTELLYNALENMILLPEEKFEKFRNNSRKLAIEKFNEKDILKLYLNLANKHCQPSTSVSIV